MAYSLRIHPNVSRKLEGIYDWGVQDSGTRAARRFVNNITKKILSLDKHPLQNPLEPMLEGTSIKWRSLVVHPYFKVIYFVDEQNSLVYIADIWDTRMNPEDLTYQINRLLRNNDLR